MNSNGPQLNWNTVTRGRRSVRNKGGDAVVGKPGSGKSEDVPIKKRRYLCHFPPSHSQAPLSCHDSSSQLRSSLSLFDDNEQLSSQCLSAFFRLLGSYPNLKLTDMDRSALMSFGEEFDYEALSKQTEARHNPGEDFSGIELLADAASMDVDTDHVGKDDVTVEDSSLPKCSNTSGFTALSGNGSECNMLDTEPVHEDDSGKFPVLNTSAATHDFLDRVEDGTNTRSNSLKVDRRHWDLNTVMDSWDEPYDDSISGKTYRDAENSGVQFEGRYESSEGNVISIFGFGSSGFKIEETRSKAKSPYGAVIMLSCLEESLKEPNDINNTTSNTSYQAIEKVDSRILSVEKIEPADCVEQIDSAVKIPHDFGTYPDSHIHMVDRADLTRFQECRDSPYEDGELRGSFLYSWENNELGMECVDYESDGRNEVSFDAAGLHGSEIVDSVSECSHGRDRKNMAERVSVNGSLACSLTESLKVHSDNNETGETNESNEESVVGKDYEGNERRCSDQSEAIDYKAAQAEECIIKPNQVGPQSCIGRSSSEAMNAKGAFSVQQFRTRQSGGLDYLSEKDTHPDKYPSEYRTSTQINKTLGVDEGTYWDSRSCYASIYKGVEGRRHNRINRMTGDTVDTSSRLDCHDNRRTSNYPPRGSYGPSTRRLPYDRENYFCMSRRMPVTRCESRYRKKISHIVGREFEENVEPLIGDATSTVILPCIPRRERNFSLGSGRGLRLSSTHGRSRSRSRTRSPTAWYSNREKSVRTMRYIRSPDFGLDARTDKLRAPFSKPFFAGDRDSSRRRWVDSCGYEDNPLKRQRSPRMSRHTQRLDTVSFSCRLKSYEYFRPASTPRRFSMSSEDRVTNYDDRKRDDKGDVVHRGKQPIQ